MSLIIPSRRGFIAGVASLIAAPAVVRASSLMKIIAVPELLSASDVAFGFLYVKPEWNINDDSYRFDPMTGAVSDPNGKEVVPHSIFQPGETTWLRISPAERAA